MMTRRITPQDVVAALKAVRDVTTGRDIVSTGQVKDIEVGDRQVSFTLLLANASNPSNQQLVRSAKEVVEALGAGEVRVRLAAEGGPSAASGASPIPRVKH